MKREVVFSRPGTAGHHKDAIGIPFSIRDGRFVATIDIEGHEASCTLDTGSSGGLTVDAAWAETHGLLAHPSVSVVSKVGAGLGESKRSTVRVKSATLGGGLRVDAPLVDTIAMPAPGDVVGIIGNPILQLCSAAVFDTTRRMLWLEPPCKTVLTEGRAHWRLEPKADGTTTRWLVSHVVPSGSAERAGIEVGDEIVRVGNVTLAADPTVLEPVFDAPAGSRVAVVLRRNGKERTVTVMLVDLLPHVR